MNRFFGCHVSSSGGIENALINGDELGVNSIQLHPSPPQKWNSKPYPKGFEDKFLERREISKVQRVFFHAIYLINLANPDPQKFQLSKLSLVHYLDLAARIGGDGVIVHVGSLKDQEDETVGFTQVADGINWILNESKNNSRLLLEVAAGSGKVIGSKMEQLAEIYRLAGKPERVGFALDTQHMWASGYDLVQDLEEVIAAIGANFGFDKVWAIHVNDSKVPHSSKKDRHENIGDGSIGWAGLRKFVNHPSISHIPMILETPHLKDMETAKIEVQSFIKLLEPVN